MYLQSTIFVMALKIDRPNFTEKEIIPVYLFNFLTWYRIEIYTGNPLSHLKSTDKVIKLPEMQCQISVKYLSYK